MFLSLEFSTYKFMMLFPYYEYIFCTLCKTRRVIVVTFYDIHVLSFVKLRLESLIYDDRTSFDT